MAILNNQMVGSNISALAWLKTTWAFSSVHDVSSACAVKRCAILVTESHTMTFVLQCLQEWLYFVYSFNHSMLATAFVFSNVAGSWNKSVNAKTSIYLTSSDPHPDTYLS